MKFKVRLTPQLEVIKFYRSGFYHNTCRFISREEMRASTYTIMKAEDIDIFRRSMNN